MGVFYDHVLIDLWPDLHRFLERHSTLRRVAKVLAYIALLVVAALVYASYEALDDHGWIPHDHDTPVWIQGDWLVGEYRDCDMLTTTAIVEGTHYTKEELVHLPRLYCASQPDGFFTWAGGKTGIDRSWNAIAEDFHTLPVSYFGRIERPNKWKIAWRCQRKSESLTCKALN